VEWDFNKNKINGVNIGGYVFSSPLEVALPSFHSKSILRRECDTDIANITCRSKSNSWLVLEPFITPALFEPYNAGAAGFKSGATVIDEYTLSLALGSQLQSTLENHYQTFIVRNPLSFFQINHVCS
jgi:hypothetical protein